jgi:hypothetical protein
LYCKRLSQAFYSATSSSTVEGNDGPDLVFGDHATILLSNETQFELVSATTLDPFCTPGNDTIYLGQGHDIGFGGAFGDEIDGGEGQVSGFLSSFLLQSVYIPIVSFRLLTTLFASASVCRT